MGGGGLSVRDRVNGGKIPDNIISGRWIIGGNTRAESGRVAWNSPRGSTDTIGDWTTSDCDAIWDTNRCGKKSSRHGGWGLGESGGAAD